MYFYHFTTASAAQNIMASSLKVGITPFSAMSKRQAVNLTNTPDPKGHGLLTGQTLKDTDPEYRAVQALGVYTPVRNPDGYYTITVADQTEAMLVIDLNISSSKLISYDKLFEKDIKNMLYPGRDKKLYDQLSATAIHSADYPFSTAHISNAQQDQEIADIINKKRKHKAPTWFFHLVDIPAKKIVEVRLKQSDGSYK
ncbi:hypothetical protein AOA59_28140 [Pseudomonas sp. 2822-15]|uniref:hypothetical protein n=1 Tax=Pseudomonas sp. 2822-15 TaxID=1712677 RepID=UPI000C157747|nr:hypothetical protein [Pseudomonas sp. 2822-15]PIB40369.1 hypothetical protein AOA59_28140 [Pseudomonas sp. 2822-15]